MYRIERSAKNSRSNKPDAAMAGHPMQGPNWLYFTAKLQIRRPPFTFFSAFLCSFWAKNVRGGGHVKGSAACEGGIFCVNKCI
jgi:hypothetical protein